MKLIYKSNLKPEKMPAWLTCILCITLDGITRNNVLENTPEEFEYIRWIIEDDQLQVKSVAKLSTYWYRHRMSIPPRKTSTKG